MPEQGNPNTVHMLVRKAQMEQQLHALKQALDDTSQLALFIKAQSNGDENIAQYKELYARLTSFARYIEDKQVDHYQDNRKQSFTPEGDHIYLSDLTNDDDAEA